MLRPTTLTLSLLLLASPAGATALDDALRGRCAADPRLTPVAEAALDDPAGFDALELRDRSHTNHLPAPTVQTLVLRGASEDLPAAVTTWLAARSPAPTLARCALAERDGTLALVLVPRLVEPRAQPTSGAVHAWQITLPAGATEATLVATSPDGTVARQPFDATGTASLPLAREGTWSLQVMMTFASGPAPVALWEEVVGEATAAAGDTDRSITNDRHLLGAINGLRRAHALAPLRRDPLLDLVARAHAQRLAAQGTVAHTPSPDDSPLDRLRAAGVVTSRVAENIARARSLAVAHARITRSPGHRANLLESEVDAIGVGVAHAGGMAYVVELFATRPTLAGR
jgi:uncharacterized protein YkwD